MWRVMTPALVEHMQALAAAVVPFFGAVEMLAVRVCVHLCEPRDATRCSRYALQCGVDMVNSKSRRLWRLALL